MGHYIGWFIGASDGAYNHQKSPMICWLKMSINDVPGWLMVWNMTFIFPYIGNVIIPIDELIFFREVGIPLTSWWIITNCFLMFVSSHWLRNDSSLPGLASPILGFQSRSSKNGLLPNKKGMTAALGGGYSRTGDDFQGQMPWGFGRQGSVVSVGRIGVV